MRSKSNAYASDISHAEDCIGEVRDWLERRNNPSNKEMLETIEQVLSLLANVYHDLREDMNDEDSESDGQPDEAQEWHDFDPDC